MERSQTYEIKHENFYRKVFVSDNFLVGRVCLIGGAVVAAAGGVGGLLTSNYYALWAGLGILGWGIVSVGIAGASRARIDIRDWVTRLRTEPGKRVPR